MRKPSAVMPNLSAARQSSGLRGWLAKRSPQPLVLDLLLRIAFGRCPACSPAVSNVARLQTRPAGPSILLRGPQRCITAPRQAQLGASPCWSPRSSRRTPDVRAPAWSRCRRRPALYVRFTDDFETLMRQTKTNLAEACPRLDVRAMARAGCFEDEQRGTYYPAHGVRIAFVFSDESITVTHSATGEPMTQQLRIERTECFRGQSRPWLGCPKCKRRAAVLFAVPRDGYVCGLCAGIAYGSQRLDTDGRSWRTEAAIEKKLGPCRTRPRYMHAATHDRLLDALDRCQQRRNLALIGWASERYKLG